MAKGGIGARRGHRRPRLVLRGGGRRRVRQAWVDQLQPDAGDYQARYEVSPVGTGWEPAHQPQAGPDEGQPGADDEPDRYKPVQPTGQGKKGNSHPAEQEEVASDAQS